MPFLIWGSAPHRLRCYPSAFLSSSALTLRRHTPRSYVCRGTRFIAHRRVSSAAVARCAAVPHDGGPPSATPPQRDTARVGVIATGVVLSLIANRVAHRMQLAGIMKYYTIFIAQSATLAYTIVYGTILAVRVFTNTVPRAQVRAALAPHRLRVLALIGVAEAVTFAIQLYAAARLPGLLIGVLAQALLPFVMLASALLLGTLYSATQILGVCCVIAGVLTSTLSTATASTPAASAAIALPAAVYGLAYALLAVAVVLKEDLLQGGTRAGMRFDVFVVNAFGSAFQCAATLVLLPLTLALTTTQPVQYLRSGLSAFFTAPHMPWLSVMYIACNIAYNVSDARTTTRNGSVLTSAQIFSLTLAKHTNSSVAQLANLFSVPFVSLVFCLRLPLLEPSPFSWFICVGLGIIVCGVLLYNYGGRRAKVSAVK